MIDWIDRALAVLMGAVETARQAADAAHTRNDLGEYRAQEAYADFLQKVVDDCPRPLA